MKVENITFWGISTGNEPFNAIIAFLFVRFVDLGWFATDQVLKTKIVITLIR